MDEQQRQVLVKLFYANDHATPHYWELVWVNAQNRITAHHGFGGLIDEGPDGAAFENVFSYVRQVEWTDTHEPFVKHIGDTPTEGAPTFEVAHIYQTVNRRA